MSVLQSHSGCEGVGLKKLQENGTEVVIIISPILIIISPIFYRLSNNVIIKSIFLGTYDYYDHALLISFMMFV